MSTQDKLAERQRFEEWYTTHAHNYSINPIGSRDCSLQWESWKAALANHSDQAQPPANTERLAELLRGLEIGPMAAMLSPKKLFAIGAAIAAQAKEAQPPAASVPDGFLRHVAAVCMGAVENCRPKASLIPEDPQEHNGGLCLNELTHIAGEIDRMLAAQENPNG